MHMTKLSPIALRGSITELNLIADAFAASDRPTSVVQEAYSLLIASINSPPHLVKPTALLLVRIFSEQTVH